MNRAKFRISFELIEDLLLLPDGAHMTGVIADPLVTVNRMFEIVVTHPDLPEHTEGADLPEVAPVYKRIEGGEPRFQSWGDRL